MSYRGNTVNYHANRSKKLWTILEYLITFRDREISQNELIELLWPEDDIENPANTLKTLLHRVRAIVDELDAGDSKDIIRYRRGAYAWVPRIKCEIDVEKFDNYFKEAYASGISPEDKLKKLLLANELYKGDFLPKSSLDQWVIPISAYYRSQYIKMVSDAAELLNAAGKYEEIVKLCQEAVVIDPYEEHLHLCLIRALVATGKQQQAMKHYDYVNELFFSKFGINPSEELSSLYKEIVKTTKSTELDLNIIKDSLREHELSCGCFYCEYEFFKNVYQLEARSAARTGNVVFLGLMTITDARGNKPPLKQINRNMDKLKETIQHSLRRGDVFTRYSVSQYLIMLPTSTYENGDMVMQRISRAFRKENPKAPVFLKYALQPLTPIGIEIPAKS